MDKFATAINCMDGRVQIPLIEYIKSKYEVNYVDMIALRGKMMSVSSEAYYLLMVKTIKRRLLKNSTRHQTL